MKKIPFYLIAAVMTVASCTGKTSTATPVTTISEFEADDEHGDGIQRMHEYNFSNEIVVDGKTYTYSIHREASDSLPLVTDDEGTRYTDNIYTLTLSNSSGEVARYRLTKRNFLSYLSPEFQSKGILDGMMCDTTLTGFQFAVSVSLPQSDMVEPLILKVDPKGGMSISRDERSHGAPEDKIQQDDGV